MKPSLIINARVAFWRDFQFVMYASIAMLCAGACIFAFVNSLLMIAVLLSCVVVTNCAYAVVRYRNLWKKRVLQLLSESFQKHDTYMMSGSGSSPNSPVQMYPFDGHSNPVEDTRYFYGPSKSNDS